MRLIDADEFESYLIGRYGGNDTAEDIIEDLHKQPTVDAVEVVRCKDCKHYHKSDAGHPDCEWCKRLICGTIKPDFFCADGERRSE